MKVPFLDVGATYRELETELDAAVKRVLVGGWYIGGAECTAFETEFAAHVGAQHCVGVGNGLDALHLALKAMRIGPGDEVIVPSNTYIATWLAVSYAGATPVPVEPDPRTYNLDPDKLEAALTPRTRAILPVHLYGQPADLEPILRFARAHGLYVLEDAAQAHGARYRDAQIGAHSDAVAWSFYPGKNLGAFGDAGALTTNNPEIADRVRVLGNYGSRVKYINEIMGVNSRLDPVQAAVLRVKLAHLESWNQRRTSIAALYLEALQDSGLILPFVPDFANPAWHLFVVRSGVRDALQQHLTEAGIGTVIHYPIPPHLQAAYSSLGYGQGSFPISEAIHQEVISLPIGPHLRLEEAEYVAQKVLEFARVKA
jgi:dTDP-4-amino-4,6-dideoxygalactose transaminase